MLRHIITFKKSNNIIINCLWNSCTSILSDKWFFDSSKNLKTIAQNFKSFSMDEIEDETLQAFGFYISITRYFEEWFLHFTNITDLELTIKAAIINNLIQIVINSKKEVIKKKKNAWSRKKSSL